MTTSSAAGRPSPDRRARPTGSRARSPAARPGTAGGRSSPADSVLKPASVMTRSAVGRLRDRRQDRECVLEAELLEVAQLAVERVHQAGAAGLQLGQAVERRGEHVVARAAAADDPDRHAVVLDQAARLDQAGDRGDRPGALLLVRPGGQDVTLVAHDPGQADARRAIDRPRDLEGRPDRAPRPVRSIPTLMSTTIGISTPRSVADLGCQPDVERVVGADDDLGAGLQTCRPFDLDPGRELVGDEDATGCRRRP